jgi:hypothetical protein
MFSFKWSQAVKSLFRAIVVALVMLPALAFAQDKPAVKKFTNSKEGLKGKFLENYVDFSFEYPAAWVEIEGDRKESKNYVKVQRAIGGPEDSFTQENFAVGNMNLTGNADADKLLIPQLMDQLKTNFKAGFPNYKNTSEGPTKFGDYEGSEIRFTSEFKHPDKGPILIYGRVVLIRHPKIKTRGVMVILLGTSLAPELKEEKDLGVKGQLPTIVKSFKLD